MKIKEAVRSANNENTSNNEVTEASDELTEDDENALKKSAKEEVFVLEII